MRIAAVVAEDKDTIVPLPEGPTVLIFDTETGKTEEWPNPGFAAQTNRRAATTGLLVERRVDLACAVPETFCPISAQAAQEHRIRFIRLEAGAKFSRVRHDYASFAAEAVASLPLEDLFRKQP